MLILSFRCSKCLTPSHLLSLLYAFPLPFLHPSLTNCLILILLISTYFGIWFENKTSGAVRTRAQWEHLGPPPTTEIHLFAGFEMQTLGKSLLHSRSNDSKWEFHHTNTDRKAQTSTPSSPWAKPANSESNKRTIPCHVQGESRTRMRESRSLVSPGH